MNKRTKKVKKHSSIRHSSKRHGSKRHGSKRHSIKRHLYRKQRQIMLLPESKGEPLFSPPEKLKQQAVTNNGNKEFGNMIPGLRNM